MKQSSRDGNVWVHAEKFLICTHSINPRCGSLQDQLTENLSGFQEEVLPLYYIGATDLFPQLVFIFSSKNLSGILSSCLARLVFLITV